MVTLTEALEDSITLDATNSAHADDVAEVISRSILFDGWLAFVDGSKVTAPAVHSAAAKVMLDTLDVEFSHMSGMNSVWKVS